MLGPLNDSACNSVDFFFRISLNVSWETSLIRMPPRNAPATLPRVAKSILLMLYSRSSCKNFSVNITEGSSNIPFKDVSKKSFMDLSSNIFQKASTSIPSEISLNFSWSFYESSSSTFSKNTKNSPLDSLSKTPSSINQNLLQDFSRFKIELLIPPSVPQG